TVPLVQTENDFAIAVRQETMAILLETFAQFAIVVDLAVADQDQRAVLVVQRLLSTGEVDDGQPTMSQRHVRVVINAFPIRAAMLERPKHAPERLLALRVGVDDASDATHFLGSDR